MIPEIDKLAREQDAAHKQVVAAIDQARNRIEALDPALPKEEIEKRARAIRNETIEKLAAHRRGMRERADEATRQVRDFTPEAVRRRARFHHDAVQHATISAAWSARLAKTSTAELIELIRDAVATRNIALGELLRLEFKSRSDRTNLDGEFDPVFAALEILIPAEADALKRVVGLAIVAQQREREFLSGRSDPIGRIAAHRAAGMVQTVKLAAGDPPPDDPRARITAHRKAKPDEAA